MVFLVKATYEQEQANCCCSQLFYSINSHCFCSLCLSHMNIIIFAWSRGHSTTLKVSVLPPSFKKVSMPSISCSDWSVSWEDGLSHPLSDYTTPGCRPRVLVCAHTCVHMCRGVKGKAVCLFQRGPDGCRLT